eukprot:COSAG02_NODE_10796_length_1856_cov_1.819010_2_plen_210_part_01
MYYCATYTTMSPRPECDAGVPYDCGCSSMVGPKDPTTGYINDQQLKNIYTAAGGCTTLAGGCAVQNDAEARALGGTNGHIKADGADKSFQSLWNERADEWTRFTSVQAYEGFEDAVSATENNPWNYGKAVQQYLNDCNQSPGVDGEGISTILMVWALFALAVMEFLLLLKIGVVSMVCNPPQKANTAVRIPIRVTVAALLSDAQRGLQDT